MYSYKVKVINPNKKVSLLYLHGTSSINAEFPRHLKLVLIESFPDNVPSHLEFQIGYFEGRSSHCKRWIISINDIDVMYKSIYGWR